MGWTSLDPSLQSIMHLFCMSRSQNGTLGGENETKPTSHRCWHVATFRLYPEAAVLGVLNSHGFEQRAFHNDWDSQHPVTWVSIPSRRLSLMNW